MRAYVAELPGVSFAAGLSFAVGYVPRHLIHLHIPAGHHRLVLAFVQRVKYVCRGVYPVVYGRGQEFQAKLCEHLDLTALGQMVIELVVDERGRHICAYMAATDDAVRAFGLKYLRIRSAFITFKPKYRCDGFLHPQTLRFQMQHVCLVLSDNVVVVNICPLGVNSPGLYRQSVYVVFFRTLATAF